MPDDHEVLRSLSPDQALERARAGLIEGEYWQQVLKDLHEVHDGVHAIADLLMGSTLAVLGLLPLVEHAGTGSLETIVEANKAAITRLHAMQRTLTGTLELSDGRSKMLLETAQAIADSLGVELDTGDDEAER